MQTPLLTIAEKSVKLSTVLKQIRAMPVVEVKLDEFAFITNDGDETKPTISGDNVVCALRSRAFEEPNEMASVYSVQGKYIVVTGKALIAKFINSQTKIFKVRFISKQALKHMLTVETPVVPETIQPIPAYERPSQYSRESNYRDRRPEDRASRPFNPPRVFEQRSQHEVDQNVRASTNSTVQRDHNTPRHTPTHVRAPGTAAGFLNTRKNTDTRGQE